MMDVIRSWILQITGAAMLTAAALSLSPSGRVKKVVALVCGLVVIAALISPIRSFDTGLFSKYMAELRSRPEEITSALDEVNDKLTRGIIEEECETYILDKATDLGITDLTVSVTARWSEEGYWYPYEVKLICETTDALRLRLSDAIEAQLGLSEEHQKWSAKDDGG